MHIVHISKAQNTLGYEMKLFLKDSPLEIIANFPIDYSVSMLTRIMLYPVL